MRERYGPWALVAGGSEGIGRSFAEQLAAQGIHLVLTARRSDVLERTAAEIRARFGVEVSAHAFDLTAADLAAKLEEAVAGREIGLLVYNAGATHGADLFLDRPVEHALALVRLDCVAPLVLTHRLAPPMQQRGRGGMILVSSMSGLVGGGYIAAYSAAKAFEIALAEALWFELGAAPIDVLCLVAGATRTPAMANSGAALGAGGIEAMEADDVAREGLAQLGKGPVWVAGERNRQLAEGLRSAPREAVIRAMSAASAQIFGKLPH